MIMEKRPGVRPHDPDHGVILGIDGRNYYINTHNNNTNFGNNNNGNWNNNNNNNGNNNRNN